jgi:hypothetical protein
MVVPTHLVLTADQIGTTTAPASGYCRPVALVGRTDFLAALAGTAAFFAGPVPVGATASLPVVFVTVAFSAAAFVAEAVRAGAFRAEAFLVVAFLVAALFGAAVVAVAFFAGAFFAVVFFAGFLAVAVRCPWVVVAADALAGAFVASAVGRFALGFRVGLGPPIAPDGGLVPMACCTTWAARPDTSVSALLTNLVSMLRASKAPM